MQQFKEINPLTIEQNPNVVAKLPDDRKPHKTWYLLIIDEHLIIANATYKERKQKWLHYQIEFPKQGLQWYLDSLKNKFFKTEAEGGLPKGVFNDSAIINGEKLMLSRAFNADGNGGGGYMFYTLDRKEDDLPKEYTFTDDLLFNHGMIDMFQAVADKIARGEL